MVVRDEWQCPECGWATGKVANWSALKAEHIRKHHPDMAETLGRPERRCCMVLWGPGCGWKCPIAGCNMGLKDAGSSGQHQHHVRMQHRAAAHPEANKELFCLPSGVNPTKASVACSNRGAAARVLGLGIARGGGHDPVWLSYPIPPPVGERKKAWKEGLLHRIFCKDCCNLVRLADDLAARDCVPGRVNPTVRKMLRRIKARIEEPNVAEYIVKATRETIRVLEAAFAEAAEEDGEHDIQAVAWPGEAWTVKFLCGRCGWLADEATGNKRSCSRLGRRRPTQAVEQLREVAKEDGPRPRAARHILDALGFKHETGDPAEEQQTLARGLGLGQAGP